MNHDAGSLKSFWWSTLLDFGEEVLVPKRKKLNLTQQQVAQKVGLNQSEISRIERGLTSPKDIPTQHVICDTYQLSTSERQKYSELVNGSTTLLTSEKRLLADLIDDQIKLFTHAGATGSLNLAITEMRSLAEWIKSNINLASDNDIANLMCDLLLKEFLSRGTYVDSENLKGSLSEVNSDMRHLASLNDESYSKLCSQLNLGLSLYINGNFQQAEDAFSSMLPDLKILGGSGWDYETLRALAISLGENKKYGELRALEKTVEDYLEDPAKDSGDKAHLLEGLAAAYSIVYPKRGLYFIRQAYIFLGKSDKNSDSYDLRTTQINRTYVKILAKLGVKSAALKRIGEPALTQAEEFKFNRQRAHILNTITR